MDKIEALTKEIHDLNEAFTAHKDDRATTDEAAIEEKMEQRIDQLVAARMEEERKKLPVRRGAPIMAYNVDSALASGLLDGESKYAKVAREIAHEGQGHYGMQNLKAVDLWLANRILEGQVEAKGKGYVGGAEKPEPPSDDLKAALKAMTSTGSGTGDELVPTDLADTLWDDIFLASRIVPSLVVIDMPTNPFNIPLGLGDVTWYKGTENTAVTASDPSTAKSTLTVTELVTEQNWSYTLDEDAVVAMAPSIRARLAISGGELIDKFALNADNETGGTGNVNCDDTTPADTSYYMSAGQLGLRHQWLADNTSQGVDAGSDALTDDDVVAMLALMGKYAVDPSQAAMYCDVGTYLKGFLDLDGVLTLAKFGPKAVLLTGQLASYRGHPVIVTSAQSKTETDGLVNDSASGTTYGQVTCANRLMWYVGFRRRLLIEVDRNIQSRSYLMVTSLREAIAAHGGTRSSNTHTAGIYDISV